MGEEGFERSMIEGSRDMEGWRDVGMEGSRDGGMEGSMGSGSRILGIVG